MKYKQYTAKYELDEEAGLFHGQVLGIRDVVTFQGASVAELVQAFHDSVDDYLEFCAEREEEPQKPYSGKFVIRISPEMHRAASVQAELSGCSLNQWVSDAIESTLENRSKAHQLSADIPVDSKLTAEAKLEAVVNWLSAGDALVQLPR